MGWWIALAVIVLLAILPLGVGAIYDEGGFTADLIVGPVKIKLFPKPKNEKPKKDKPKKKGIKSEKTSSGGGTKKNDSKNGGPITDFLPLLKTALDLLNDFRRKLRINRMEAKVILAGGDPCDLAVNYGKAWTAVGNIMPHLERFLVIKKRDIQIECDFVDAKTTIYVCLDLTITLGRLIWLLVRYGVRALKEYLTIMKKRKGGAAK